MRNLLVVTLLFGAIVFFSACRSAQETTVRNAANEKPAAPLLKYEVPRPQKILDQMGRRGDLDKARPSLQIIEPAADAKLSGAKSRVKVKLGEESKEFTISNDQLNGNQIQLFLNEKPIGVISDLNTDFELPELPAGEYVLRAFPVRPWGESFKNPEALQTVQFSVTADNQKSTASKTARFDSEAAFLTFNFVRTEFAVGEPIILDFWISNARLRDRGGDYRVRFSIDDGEAQFIDRWEAIWLGGLSEGTHRIRLELVGRVGRVVENGGVNSVVKEFVVKR